jgi:hypothetical protein
MGVTKKATVVAKTATRKRGRPAGSKNKPKTTIAKASITSESSIKVDWEKLAKRLQEALAAQIKENEAMEKVLVELKSVIRLDNSFTFFDRLVFLFTGKI